MGKRLSNMKKKLRMRVNIHNVGYVNLDRLVKKCNVAIGYDKPLKNLNIYSPFNKGRCRVL